MRSLHYRRSGCLSPVSTTQVFKPPNPWTIAIMSVLSELHAVPELKVGETCEVESNTH